MIGDFNARIHGRREDEEGALGNYIFGRGLSYLNNKVNERKVLNRDLLLEVAKEGEYKIITHSSKKNRKNKFHT